MTMTLIETKTLGTAAATIEFTSIPQDGTDLLVLFSGRATTDNASATWIDVTVYLNSSLSGYSLRYLFSDVVGGVSSGTGATTSFNLGQAVPDSATTANTFSNFQMYIPNYSGSTNKSVSFDNVNENNASQVQLLLQAGLWANTAAINTLTYTISTGNLAAGSTISLYKITKGSSGGVVVS